MALGHQHGPFLLIRPQASTWHLVAHLAIDVFSDPCCCWAMNLEMTLNRGPGPGQHQVFGWLHRLHQTTWLWRWHSLWTSIRPDVLAQTPGFQGPLVATWTTDFNKDPGCFWATDPHMVTGSNFGLDPSMVQGGSSGQPDQHHFVGGPWTPKWLQVTSQTLGILTSSGGGNMGHGHSHQPLLL